MRVFQIFQQKFCSLEDHRAKISIAESYFGKKKIWLFPSILVQTKMFKVMFIAKLFKEVRELIFTIIFKK